MKRNSKNVFILFVVCLGLTGQFNPIYSQEIPEIVQITTHPSPDFQPAISPDGEWLAWVSEQSGNLDIWVKRLPRGNSVQITVHPSEDLEPAWSPDSKRLVFVSKRRDAFGDLWMVKLNAKQDNAPDGEPVQLTHYLGADRRPSFSPDGRKIVFDSERSGRSNLWVYDLSSKRESQLTFNGGMEPAWSPDGKWILFTSFRSDPGGDLCLIDSRAGSSENPVYPVTAGTAIDGSGKWSTFGDKIIFRRMELDSSEKRRSAPNSENSAVWQKSVVIREEMNLSGFRITGKEFQITPESEQAKDPCFGNNGEVYTSSNRNRGRDIWSLPEDGLFKRQAFPEEQYLAVWERFGEATSEMPLEYSILGYRRVLDYFPEDSLWCAHSLIRMGETFDVLGEKTRAKRLFEQIQIHYPNQKREAAESLIKLAGFLEDPVSVRMGRCRAVLNAFPDDPAIQAEACILLGDIQKENRNIAESLASYGRVLKMDPSLRNWKAQAQLKIGDLFLSQGEIETAQQSYLAVLREYGDVPLWRDRAGKRLLDQIRGTPQSRIVQYQQISQQLSDYPSLIAEAQLAVAWALIEEKQYERAFSELEQMESLVPGLFWAHAKAKIAEAHARSMGGDDLKGIFLLESAVQQFGSIEGGRFVSEANDSLFALLFRSAERLKATGDFNLGAVRYQKALDLKSDDLPCHRGWVECLYRIGRIDEAVSAYQKKTAEAPHNPILLYGMGLALSYQGEKDSELLKKSNEYLVLSLDENYRLVPPYRTLGFNYEAMEGLDEIKRQEKHGWLTRTVQFVGSPVRWAFGLLPLRRKTEQAGYYEKAIQALSTALDLNDENIDPLLEARLAQNLANNFYNLGEYGFARAFQYYRLRLRFDTTFSNPIEKAMFFERAGHCALFIEEMEPAAVYLQKAVQQYSDMGREEESMLSMRRLAMLNYQAGKYEEAIQVFQALATRDEKANRQAQLELDYRNMAFNYHLYGEDGDALKYALRAEEILKTWNIPEKPPKKSYLRIELFGFSIPVWGMEEIGGALSEGFTEADEAAMVYGLISRSQEALKQYDAAIAYEQKRLSLFRNRKDKFAERICLNRLGLLHYKLTDFEKAWDYFMLSRQAALKKKVKDDFCTFVNAVNLGNVAMVEHVLLGKEDHWSRAVQCLTDEYGKWNQRKDLNRRERMTLANALGVLWLFQVKGNAVSVSDPIALAASINRFQGLAQAENYFQESLKLARESESSREEAVVLKNLGETYEYAGDLGGAVSVMRQSLNILERIADPDWIWRVRSGLADLEGRLSGNMGKESEKGLDPLAQFELAMDELESLPVQEEGSEELLSDRRERQDLYAHASFLAADKGLVEKALEMAERGKEKETADMLARRPPELKKERHRVAWGNLRYYRTQLMDLRKSIHEEQQGKKRTALIDSLSGEERKYIGDYQEQLKSIREEDPVLSYISGAEPIDVLSILKRIPENGCALIYLAGENRTLLWFADRDTVGVVTIPFGKIELERKAEVFIAAVNNLSGTDALCREWYDRLILPAEPFIREKRRLIIVPDRTIWSIPFEALSNGEKTLLESCEISYSPSLAAYQLAWDRRRINLQKGLLVGELRDDDLAQSLSRICPEPSVLFDKQATEGAFKEQSLEADVIQIDKRIVPDPDNPLRSAIVLAPDSLEDGFVSAGDLFRWDVKASLVMLTDSPVRTWNPDPFFHALTYAGIPTVVMPLWPVDRETKQRFTQQFYQTASDSSLTRALQEAGTAVKGRGAPVRYWAGFRLIGFGGMDSDERQSFARENLTETVLQARTYEQKEEYSDAVGFFEKALSMSETTHDTTSTVNLWREIVRVGMKGKIWNKAVSYQMRLIQQAERLNDTTAVLNGYRNLSAFCVQNNWFEAAAKAKLKAIDILEKRNRTNLAAAQYEELAFIHEREQKYQQAVAASQKAYDLYRELNNPAGMARALIRKGRFLLEAEQVWSAHEALRTGASVLDTIQQNENDVYELASGYTLLGLASERLTRYDEAFRYQEKALSLFEKLNRTTQAAQTRQYLANLYWKTGNYRMALSLQRKALETFETLQNEKLLIMAYGTLGLIQSSLGDLAKAEESEQKALDLAEKTNNMPDKAAILKNLGIIRIQQNQLAAAMELQKKATAIDSTLGLASGLGSDYRNLGNLLIRMDRPRESIALFRKGIGLSNQTGDRRNAVQCFFGLGQALFNLGDRKSALAALDTGLVTAEALSIPDLTWRLYRQKAKLLAQSGQNEAAFQEYQRAVDVVEKQRTELKVASFQQGFLDDKMDLYTDAVRLLLDMSQPARAFDFVERAKSRSFIDLLGNQKPAMKKSGETLLASEQAARNAVQEAQERLVELARRKAEWTQKDRDSQSVWTMELDKRRKAYEDRLAVIQSESPELASLVSVDPDSVPQIQSHLPDSTALVEYYISADELFIWLLTSQRLIDFRVRIPAVQIGEAVRNFREGIQARLSVDRESRMLYDWLIEPAAKELIGIRHLVFVPHGILHYLPFSALKNKEGRFLIDRFSLSLVPSGTVLGYCMDKMKNRTPSKINGTNVLAVANPDLGDMKFNLAFADKEVQSLKRTFGSVTSFSRETATEEAVRHSMDDRFRLVHFACHGEYQAEAPLFSALLLSPDQGDDGRLEAQEIFGMNFDCDLVTLSACETGLATVTRGDEIIGLARSFIFAGAPSVITSLWKVDDLATAVLMKRFYRYLKNGDSRAEALRRAQLLVRESLNAHPSAWAAFNITGDFR